jgi:hypothetical protein
MKPANRKTHIRKVAQAPMEIRLVKALTRMIFLPTSLETETETETVLGLTGVSLLICLGTIGSIDLAFRFWTQF